jgi:hypothetical protein
MSAEYWDTFNRLGLAAGHYRLVVFPGHWTPVSGEFDATP